MEENNLENKDIINTANNQNKGQNNSQIAGAILIAGVLIAGAVLLKGSSSSVPGNVIPGNGTAQAQLAPAKVGASDRVLGNPNAKITLIMYEDFQCPFCGKFAKESEQPIRDTYVKNGDVLLVYRDFAFLGEESNKAAEAARCAGEQGKFWEYHDYLFTHQNGENKGGFSNPKLKDFAANLGLDEISFNQCLSSDRYALAVADSASEGKQAGVQGTPKGFILKGGKVVATIDGAQPFATVKQKIDSALK